MATEHALIDPSSAMTVVSFLTFIGILWWTFYLKRSSDFDSAAMLPFADEDTDAAIEAAQQKELHHG
jgi:cytochrome c oxidase cbb3-type subunit 4